MKLQRYDFPLGTNVKVLSCRHNLLVILHEDSGKIFQTGINIGTLPVDQIELVMCIIRQNGKIADIFGVAQLRQRHLRCKCNAHIDGYRFQSALQRARVHGSLIFDMVSRQEFIRELTDPVLLGEKDKCLVI